jgi:energy-coupling factor transporter ATP-binding protein EcfA2
MKLHEINVQKFRCIENMRLSFENALGQVQPVTVLVGPNGCGKTSVLFAIVQALRGIMGYRTDDVPEPAELDIFRSGNGEGFTRTRPRVSVTLHVEFDSSELQAIPQVFEDTMYLHNEPRPSAIGNGRVTVDWKYPPSLRSDGTPLPTWYVDRLMPRHALPWFKGRLYAIRGWRDQKLSRLSLLDEIGGPMLFPQDRNLKTRVTGASIAQGEAEESRAEENVYGRSREKTVWEILKYLGQLAADGGGIIGGMETWEGRIKEQFNRICAPKEYLGFLYHPNDPQGSPYFKDGASTYSLSVASSGEQVILEYITRMTYPSPMNHSLVLIDEPEVHLHPGWVRQLYHALPSIGQDNQFILTTHSSEMRELAVQDGVHIDLGDLQR